MTSACNDHSIELEFAPRHPLQAVPFSNSQLFSAPGDRVPPTQDHAAIMLPLVLLLLVSLAEAKGPHHPHASHHHYHPQPSPQKKLTKDEQILHDRQHINEDLGDSWSDDRYLTDEEMEFRYFKVHDFDNNTKLDGLEIYQAIKHSMENSNSGYGTESWIEKENTIIGLIDQVLLEDDTDFDGYLSYAEYVIGRQKEKDRRNKK